MSFAAILRATLLRTLFLCGILLGPLTGCNEVKHFCALNWIDGDMVHGHSEHAVNDMVTLWDNHVRITEDSENGGGPLPGMVGRLYLFNNGAAVDAHGSVVVQVFDMTHASPTQPPLEVGKWTFPPLVLKQLKKKDPIGEGYTLFLPWTGYSREVREVKVQVAYMSEKGTPRYSSPSKVTFQTDDLPPPVVQQRTFAPGQDKQARPIAPVSHMVPPAPQTLVPLATPTLPNWN